MNEKFRRKHLRDNGRNKDPRHNKGNIYTTRSDIENTEREPE